MVFHPNRRKHTISDIAREMGVSKTTVSRAINNKPDILPETRKRILELVEKYNYQPSALAKGININKSNTIGIIIPHDIDYILMNPYYDEIIRGIVKEADVLGYFILLIYCRNKNYLNVIYQDRLDGLIVISPGLNHKNIVRNIEKTQIPFILTSRMPEVETVPHLCVNDHKGAKIAVRHLLELGHYRIGFINGPLILASSLDRLRGYKDTLEENGIPFEPKLVVEGANTLETGFQSMEILLDSAPPTAVFIAGDFMALGAMNAVQKRGLRIPKDISVIGFDGIQIAGIANPPLTTINQSILNKGKRCVDLLVDLISGKDVPVTTELDVDIVVRESTGPAPRGSRK
jgi:LacI family transcriptional regulator